MDTPDDSLLRTTHTSLEVLRHIKVNNGSTLAALSEDLDLARSTVHSHLATLQEHGYVVKEGAEYALGMYLLHLGVQARNRSAHFQVARTYVEELAQETDLEVDFTVEENGREITLYDAVGGTESSDIQVGSCFHLHNNGAGKAILAELSADRVDDIIETWGLPATTENTITDRAALEAELAEIREQGYAYNNQELLDGYSSISMVATFPTGELYGALALGGPAYRVEVEEAQIIEHLSTAVAGIERELAEGAGNVDPNWWKQIWDCDRVTDDG